MRVFSHNLQYDCINAPLELNNKPQSWWRDRNGAKHFFWAGAKTNNRSHTCQCGIDGDCVDPSYKCNCDAMKSYEMTDSGNLLIVTIPKSNLCIIINMHASLYRFLTGYLTDKSLLPVTRLSYGRIIPGASGKYTLGKFECSGRVTRDDDAISSNNSSSRPFPRAADLA